MAALDTQTIFSPSRWATTGRRISGRRQPRTVAAGVVQGVQVAVYFRENKISQTISELHLRVRPLNFLRIHRLR